MKHNGQTYLVSRPDGFTIIEVMIVIVIFSIGILGAMSMQTKAVTTNATTRKSTLAMEYATDTMERLMRIGNEAQDNKFGVDEDGDGTPDNAAESQLTDGIDNDDDGFTDETDEQEWWLLPEFAAGPVGTRGINIPADAYYSSIFNLFWAVTDVDCDADGWNDSKRIDITVTWDNNNQTMQLTNIRTNIM